MTFDPGTWDPRDRSQDEPQRQRLEQLVNRLSDADLQTPLGGGWTVAVALAHIAFWDRRAAALVKLWQQRGSVQTYSEGVDTADIINEAATPTWQALPPRAAANEALAAADAADRALDQGGAALVERIMAAGPPINPARAIHRAEHLDQIEQALGRPSP